MEIVPTQSSKNQINVRNGDFFFFLGDIFGPFFVLATFFVCTRNKRISYSAKTLPDIYVTIWHDIVWGLRESRIWGKILILLCPYLPIIIPGQKNKGQYTWKQWCFFYCSPNDIPHWMVPSFCSWLPSQLTSWFSYLFFFPFLWCQKVRARDGKMSACTEIKKWKYKEKRETS